LVNVALLGVPAAVKANESVAVSDAGPALASSPTPVIRIGIAGFAEVLRRVTYALLAPTASFLKVKLKVHDVPGMTGVEQAWLERVPATE
jgi:hypothetical protein